MVDLWWHDVFCVPSSSTRQWITTLIAMTWFQETQCCSVVGIKWFRTPSPSLKPRHRNSYHHWNKGKHNPRLGEGASDRDDPSLHLRFLIFIARDLSVQQCCDLFWRWSFLKAFCYQSCWGCCFNFWLSENFQNHFQIWFIRSLHSNGFLYLGGCQVELQLYKNRCMVPCCL